MKYVINSGGLGYTVDLSQGDASIGLSDPYPAKIDVFTDAGSALHVAAGLGLALLPVPWSLVGLAFFAAYELSKASAGEPWTRTGGKFAELGLGMLAGKAVKR